MRQKAGREGEQDHARDPDSDPFTETLAPLVGLGKEERGKEDTEVHQDAVRLGNAQLDRTGPERRECRPNCQTQDQTGGPIERPRQDRPACNTKHEQADDHQPDDQSGDVTIAQFIAASGQRQATDQSDWTEERRRFL
ncbi:MAG TPA: hypothetical protein VH299_06645 [Solirubrobacterales bacterium]|nr:hypothetical protein [Solirubrobacterales bacterium]